MSTLDRLCRDAVAGIKDSEGIYTEERLNLIGSMQQLKYILMNYMIGLERLEE